jgi:hypothetical protein
MKTSAADVRIIVVAAANISRARMGRRYVVAPTAFFSCGEHGLAWQEGKELSPFLSISQPGIFDCIARFCAALMCRGHIPFAQQFATCVDASAFTSGEAYVPARAAIKIRLANRRSIIFRPIILLHRTHFDSDWATFRLANLTSPDRGRYTRWHGAYIYCL